MRRRALTVVIVAGEPELHAWCPVCLLPSRIRVPLHLDDVAGPTVGVLEICPGCGTGHDKPSVTATPAPPGEVRGFSPLADAARAVHRWACRRRGLISRICAYGDCRWPGLYRHEHTLLADEGVWRYVFCRRRHRLAWAAHHDIAYLHDRGDAG